MTRVGAPMPLLRSLVGPVARVTTGMALLTELPDYAARRRMILGDKVLPNMVLLGREQERW